MFSTMVMEKVILVIMGLEGGMERLEL